MRLSNLLNRCNPNAPKGIIWRTDEWLAAQSAPWRQLRRSQPSAWMREIYPADEAFRPMDPSEIDKSAPGEFNSLRWTASPAANLFYLGGCRVLGDEGAIVSPDNRVFADFTMPPANDWNEHACFRRRRIPRVQHLKGWYATIGWPEAKVFSHWMVESLPRMALLADVAPILDGIFVPGPLKPYQIEAMHALGVPEEKLIPLSPTTHCQPEHLFVPRFYSMYNPPTWMHAWFKSELLAAPGTSSTGPRRLYVSRADAPHRRIVNEGELIAALEPLGFSAVQLSKLPFQSQARLFNDADVIVGPHGAGLAHLVFCRAGTRVLEIYASKWMPPAFMPLAHSAGCKYRYVAAEDLSHQPNDGRFGHLKVNVGLVLEKVNNMLEAQ